MHINMNMELGGQQQQNFEREYKIRSLLRCCFLAGNFFLPFFHSFHGARLSLFFFFSLCRAPIFSIFISIFWVWELEFQAFIML